MYVLYSSSSNKYYVGFSANVDSRLYKHNKKHKGFTAQADDWIIVYSESFANKPDALAREKQIKQWKSRKAIENLIRSAG